MQRNKESYTHTFHQYDPFSILDAEVLEFSAFPRLSRTDGRSGLMGAGVVAAGLFEGGSQTTKECKSRARRQGPCEEPPKRAASTRHAAGRESFQGLRCKDAWRNG